MKAVLISVQPKWCQMIADGKKTVEVRKSRPKLSTPFKCYIYCTRPRFPHEDYIVQYAEGKAFYAGGKVIGEFVCNATSMNFVGYKDGVAGYHDLLNGSCLSEDNLMEYGNWKTLYGWHISRLEIYDEPKKLSEFTGLRKSKFGYEPVSICRPPQSWCYVEEDAT